MLRIHESVKDELHADLVVSDMEFLLHLGFSCRLMGDATDRKSDLLNETLGKKVIHIVALHVQKLVLDGGAAAIDNKNDHYSIIFTKTEQSYKIISTLANLTLNML